MAVRRINCFVAMAFGRNDCEEVYLRRIVPVLRKLCLNPIRVDRRQHRDDLNNFIIRMLKSSDIVLADLTYARPSVYYEAGFAERMLPVVYTVRKDHLSRAQQDDRLRVHFDLEMKKIVDWSTPNDTTFQSRLKARIKYLLKPLLEQKEKKECEDIEAKAFLTLSVTERCERVLRQFTRQLRLKRFWFRPLGDIDKNAWFNIALKTVTVAAKMDGRKAVSVTIVIAESITQKHIQRVLQFATGSRLIDNSCDTNISQFDNHVFFCSLSRIPSSRLTSAFPDATPDRMSSECYHIFQKTMVDNKSLNTTIWLLGTLSSERKVAEIAQQCMGRISGRKTNDYTCLSISEYKTRNSIIFKRAKKPNH